jgi:hypothetical protein
MLDYERGAARHFLNAEPTQAVQSALNGRNPVGDFRELSRLVAADPDAKAGLTRAVADYLTQRIVRAPVGEAATGTMNAGALDGLLQRNAALREVLTPEQIHALHNIAADLQRSSMPLPKGQGAVPQGGAAGKLSLLSGPLGHGMAGLAGYLLGGVHGAFEGYGVYAAAKTALDAIRRPGIEKIDQLLTEALLNPELAKTLLMKATPANRPLIAQRLASQLGTLAAVGSGQAAGEDKHQQGTAALAAVPRPLPSAAPMSSRATTGATGPVNSVAAAPSMLNPTSPTLAQILARQSSPPPSTAFSPLAGLLARIAPHHSIPAGR